MPILFHGTILEIKTSDCSFANFPQKKPLKSFYFRKKISSRLLPVTSDSTIIAIFGDVSAQYFLGYLRLLVSKKQISI